LARSLKSWAWLVPLAFAAALAGIGWSTYRAVEADIKRGLADELTTLLDADVAALRMWVQQHQRIAESQASEPRLRRAALELARISRRADDPLAELQAAPQGAELRPILEPALTAHAYTGYWVMLIHGRILAAADPSHVGGMPPKTHDDLMDRLLEGKSAIRPPRRIEGVDDGGGIILVAAPILDDAGKPAAALLFGSG
jgi:hypothetical protein